MNGFLTLGRVEGESVMIGDIEVIVSRVDRGHVRLSIRAPREVPIVRKELLTQEQLAYASGVSPGTLPAA